MPGCLRSVIIFRSMPAVWPSQTLRFVRNLSESYMDMQALRASFCIGVRTAKGLKLWGMSRASQGPRGGVAGGILAREEERSHLRQQALIAQRSPCAGIPAEAFFHVAGPLSGRAS